MTLTTKTTKAPTRNVDDSVDAYNYPAAKPGTRPHPHGALDKDRNRKAGRERFVRPDGSMGWRPIRKTNQ